jgi:hypothetical protein
VADCGGGRWWLLFRRSDLSQVDREPRFVLNVYVDLPILREICSHNIIESLDLQVLTLKAAD